MSSACSRLCKRVWNWNLIDNVSSVGWCGVNPRTTLPKYVQDTLNTLQCLLLHFLSPSLPSPSPPLLLPSLFPPSIPPSLPSHPPSLPSLAPFLPSLSPPCSLPLLLCSLHPSPPSSPPSLPPSLPSSFFTLSRSLPPCHRFHRIGLLVLFYHDIGDVLLELAKCFNYFQVQGGKPKWLPEMAANITFGIFTIQQ